MDKLEEKIGYRFRDRELLRTALTHSSYANEHHGGTLPCYERLEFLGDSILGLVTAEYLFRHEPPLPEGSMTRLRAELVCEQALHKAALELGLPPYMRLGRGEENTGGRQRASVLADMVEAVIAALYLDSGLEEARRFVLEKVLRDAEISGTHRSRDYKTALQELVQREPNRHIAYEQTGESGPDHNKSFTFRVTIDGETAGEGVGRTKKEAEQQAARRALEALQG